MGLRIGIDASSLRTGGGVTHLVELLRHVDPSRYEIERIIVWGAEELLERLPSRNWCDLRSPQAYNRSLLHRLYWQQVHLASEVNRSCDVLFVPGGLYLGRFRPYVTMMRNMLPFDPSERKRYGMTSERLRLLLLRFGQRRTFSNAAGTIFLSRTARDAVEELSGPLEGKTAVIPHGVNSRFASGPREAKPIESYDQSEPFEWVYVSRVEFYKHQWNVVEAVRSLRKEGYPVSLRLVGSAEPTAKSKLDGVLDQGGEESRCVEYLGRVPYRRMNEIYQQADAFIFASTCEAFGQALVEAMSAGLVVVCSNQSAIPEIAGKAGVYFDPNDTASIRKEMRNVMENEDLRREKSKESAERSEEYEWGYTTRETFNFIEGVVRG